MVGLIMKEELIKEFLIDCNWECIRIIRYYKPFVEFTIPFRGDFETEVTHLIKIDEDRFSEWYRIKRQYKLNQLI